MANKVVKEMLGDQVVKIFVVEDDGSGEDEESSGVVGKGVVGKAIVGKDVDE